MEGMKPEAGRQEPEVRMEPLFPFLDSAFDACTVVLIYSVFSLPFSVCCFNLVLTSIFCFYSAFIFPYNILHSRFSLQSSLLPYFSLTTGLAPL